MVSVAITNRRGYDKGVCFSGDLPLKQIGGKKTEVYWECAVETKKKNMAAKLKALSSRRDLVENECGKL